MSGWLRRLSTTYRMAVAAEAAGDYLEAAKAYALCEERHKVAEMHILEAARRAVPGSAAAELLIAANFLHDDESAPQALLRRLGEALLRLVRSRDLIDSDRELATVAAQVLRRAGEPLLAAEAYQRVGDVDRAVELLSLAGEVERVEQLLSGHQSEREQAERERELTASYESAQRLGRRDEALSLLQAVVRSGRRIVGFDLTEVAPGPDPADEWDANVGARALYKLIGFALLSQKRPS